MTNQVIPEAAVEAAAPWIVGFLERRGMALRGDEAKVLARYVIEAAAPHMLAEAWDEGFITAEDEARYHSKSPNPYRTTP